VIAVTLQRIETGGQRLGRIVTLIFLCTLLLALNIADPNDLSPVSCRFHQLTGHSCPTCGMTRSLHAATHFDFVGAFRFHMIGPPLFVVLVVFIIKYIAELFAGLIFKLGLPDRFARHALITAGVVWVVFWLIRLGGESGFFVG
jgi:hypothetical protein